MEKTYTLKQFVELFNENAPNELWCNYTLVIDDNDTHIREATDDEKLKVEEAIENENQQLSNTI